MTMLNPWFNICRYMPTTSSRSEATLHTYIYMFKSVSLPSQKKHQTAHQGIWAMSEHCGKHSNRERSWSIGSKGLSGWGEGLMWLLIRFACARRPVALAKTMKTLVFGRTDCENNSSPGGASVGKASRANPKDPIVPPGDIEIAEDTN